MPIDSTPSKRAATPLPERIGKYPIVGVIGKGSMGVVYKGLDPIIQRPLAIKTIRRDLLDDSDNVAQFGARFRNEAQAAGRLAHPNIVAVHDYGEDADLAYIAMEYIEGHSVRQYVARQTRFDEADIVSIMAQLLDALHYAHERGVLHRDIKPSNLIVLNDGRVKITDFGIARVESSTLTQIGAVMGTPGFMAPEQYIGEHLDRRVDVFAAGVVLFQLFTGALPFTGTPEAIMFKVCYESPPLPSATATLAGVERFDAVVLRALARQPDDRFGSAAEFLTALLAASGMAPNPTISEQTIIRLGPPPLVPGSSPAGPAARGTGPSRRRGVDTATRASHAAADGSGERPATFGSVPTSLLVQAGWDLAVLAAVETKLAKRVGPIARVLVRRAALAATSLPELVDRVAASLTDASVRSAFLREQLPALGALGSGRTLPPQSEATVAIGATPPAADRLAEVVDPATIERAGKVLTRYAGPIAPLLARKAGALGLAEEAFFEHLAQAIADPAARREFLVRVTNGGS